MKRVIPFLTALLMLLPLAACGTKSPPQQDPTDAPTDTGTSPSTAEDRENTPDSLPQDLSFDGAEVGIFYGSFDTVFDNTLYEMEGPVTWSQTQSGQEMTGWKSG